MLQVLFLHGSPFSFVTSRWSGCRWSLGKPWARGERHGLGDRWQWLHRQPPGGDASGAGIQGQGLWQSGDWWPWPGLAGDFWGFLACFRKMGNPQMGIDEGNLAWFFGGGPEGNPRWKAQPCDRISLMFRGSSLKLGWWSPKSSMFQDDLDRTWRIWRLNKWIKHEWNVIKSMNPWLTPSNNACFDRVWYHKNGPLFGVAYSDFNWLQ